MFQKARLKLTAWYLLIIMMISISFSVAMYEVLTFELDRVEKMQALQEDRLYRLPNGATLEFRQRPRYRIDPELIEEVKYRLKTMLFLINVGILGTSSLAGYFLAGRTLKPIAHMVDEQNRFISDASHELRTPITSLKTATEVYLRDPKHTLDEADALHKSNLDEINSLQALSDNLIKLTQFKKTHSSLVFTNLQFSDIVEDALKKVATLAKFNNITIDNDVKKYTIEADRQSLTELFVILLDNAIKYSPHGTTVNITSVKKDGCILVKVKDEGIGIAKKDIPHIFKRFYRVDSSRTKKEVSGYGLGLSIAKEIVEKHRGHIKVASSVGKGTTFSIQLPVKQPQR